MSERPGWLDELTPDPEMQVTAWSPGGPAEGAALHRQSVVRRAFLRWLIVTYEVETMDHATTAIERRFGARPHTETVKRDMRALGIVRVPIVGTRRYRYRLLSSLHDVGVEEELNERIRIDVLRLDRDAHTIYLETNRGTATALSQLLKLAHDDGVMRDIQAITTDGDCYVVVHMTTSKASQTWEAWLRKRVV